MQIPDIIQNINSFLPLKDQYLTTSNVCKVWRSISQSFRELAQVFLENKRRKHQFFDYSDEELKIIIDLAAKNNLISLIKQNAGFCVLGRKGKSYFSSTILNEKFKSFLNQFFLNQLSFRIKDRVDT